MINDVCKGMGGRKRVWGWKHTLTKDQNQATISHPTLRKIIGTDALKETEGSRVIARIRQNSWVSNQAHRAMLPRLVRGAEAAACAWARGHEWADVLCEREPAARRRYMEPDCSNEEIVMMLACGYMDGADNNVSAGTPFDLKRWFNRDHTTQPPNMCVLKQDVVVFDRLAITPSSFPASLGHLLFVMTKVILLHDMLPDDVKILVYEGKFPTRFHEPLFKSGRLSRERIVFQNTQQHAYYARELYWKFNSHYEHLGNGMLEHHRLRDAYVPSFLPLAKRNRLIVIKRETSRSVTNHDAMVAALNVMLDKHDRFRSVFPEGVQVSVFDKPKWGATLEDDIAFFSGAAMLVGPHGAGLQNSLFLAPGTPVLEICYESKATMQCPHMYYLLASNLGLPYYSSISPGSYGGRITVNPAHIAELVERAFLMVTGDGDPEGYDKEAVDAAAGSPPTDPTEHTNNDPGAGGIARRAFVDFVRRRAMCGSAAPT